MGVEGTNAVLQLRYQGDVWGEQNLVHVELCDFVPDAKPWAERHQGKWVESHAGYRKLIG